MSSLGAHNSGPDEEGPDVPEPSHAEKARTLVHLQQTGGLSTPLTQKATRLAVRIGDAVRIG